MAGASHPPVHGGHGVHGVGEGAKTEGHVGRVVRRRVELGNVVHFVLVGRRFDGVQGSQRTFRTTRG